MTLSAARHRALAEIDALPPDLRACVHEFGYPIVRACMKFGVKRPVHIRELVREIWLGPREDFQTGGAKLRVVLPRTAAAWRPRSAQA